MQAFGLARLGRDAELRNTANGDAVCNLSLAFSYGRKREDGKRPTQWVEGVLWGARAEALAPYLVKGARFAVTLDEVRLETYTARDNSTGTKMIGRVSNIEFAGDPPAPQAPAPAPRATSRTPAPAPRPAGRTPSGFDDMDDDIPF